MITYNHEAYIADCLKSIVDQKTDFRFEVVVSDDGSTDKTPEIITNFQRNYPNIIVPILHRENHGMPTKNYLCAHNAARGKYIAHVDGDDLVLPGKLQKQADFLDKNPKCSVVWHSLIRFQDNEESLVVPIEEDEQGITQIELVDMLRGNLGVHSSTMYRSGARKTRETEVDIMDWKFYLEYLSKGYGVLMHEALGGYRVCAKGSISMSGGGGVNTSKIFANHLLEAYKLYPRYKQDIFMHSAIMLIRNIQNNRKSLLQDLKVMLATFSWVTPLSFYRLANERRQMNILKTKLPKKHW